MTVEKKQVIALAKIVHQANKAFCENIGDTSQKDWEETPDDIQDSAIDGVQAICDDPSITPEDTHQVWADTKTKQGWVHGETKDAKKKTHPCLVPYEDLPVTQQFKDHLFHAIVHSYLKFTGDEA